MKTADEIHALCALLDEAGLVPNEEYSLQWVKGEGLVPVVSPSGVKKLEAYGRRNTDS